MKINPITNNFIKKNTKKCLTATFFALSVFGLSNINSCSKIDVFEKEDKNINEQNDTTKQKDFIHIDDTYEEIIHEIVLTDN